LNSCSTTIHASVLVPPALLHSQIRLFSRPNPNFTKKVRQNPNSVICFVIRFSVVQLFLILCATLSFYGYIRTRNHLNFNLMFLWFSLQTFDAWRTMSKFFSQVFNLLPLSINFTIRLKKLLTLLFLLFMIGRVVVLLMMMTVILMNRLMMYRLNLTLILL
jgi:hypothetical protein